MGNAPLPSPPRSTSTRFVLYITTPSRVCGTRLQVVGWHSPPPPHNNGNVSATETSTETLPNSLPSPLCSTRLSPQDYHDKMRALQARLDVWKGGKLSILVLALALLVVLGFVAAYMIPDFWASALFDHPLYIFALGVCLVVMFIALLRWIRAESTSLLRDVKGLFKEWRQQYNIYVDMKRVASVRGTYFVTAHGIRRVSPSSSMFCYALVMDVLSEEQARQRGRDHGREDDGSSSVATVDMNEDEMDDESMSGDQDDDHDDDEVEGTLEMTASGLPGESTSTTISGAL